jgi:hypothetical protein
MQNGLIISSLGTKQWYLNGQLHRTDGPAVEWHDGSKRWFLIGKEYSNETEWKRMVKLLAFI